MDKIYTDVFFDNITAGSIRSAEIIVPILISIFRPSSVIDVGCGAGAWLSIFAKSGVDNILGIDGDYVNPKRLLIGTDQFLARDVSQFIDLKQRFDLALCLEVAEHISPEYSDTLISNLVRLSDIVAFSAAIPFQGGDNHVNEQLPEYWITKFAKHNYIVFDFIRPAIWGNEQVEFWYQQNLLVFIDQERMDKFEHLHDRISQEKFNFLRIHPKTYQIIVRRLSKLYEKQDNLIHKVCRHIQATIKRRFP